MSVFHFHRSFVEVFDEADKEFGMARIAQIVAERSGDRLEAIAGAVAVAARAHGPQLDDQSILLVRFTGIDAETDEVLDDHDEQ